MCFHKFFNFDFFRNLVFGFGLTFVALAVSCNVFWNQIFKWAVKKEFVLSPSSKSFDLWEKNPFPFHIDFYFFNWTNPTNLSDSSFKPELVEVGPYRFREEVKKIEIKWNENKTVTYRKLRRWYFEPEKSCGSLDDVITSLNVIAVTAARSTRHWTRMSRVPLSMTLSLTQNLAISKQVRELLFEGFADPLIEFASKIPSLSSQVPFDKFGWFYKALPIRQFWVLLVVKRPFVGLGLFLLSFLSYSTFPYLLLLTSSVDPQLVMTPEALLLSSASAHIGEVLRFNLGASGLDVLGELKFWNFKNHTPFYEGPCGEVKGSAGDFWPPQKPQPPDKITLFSPDMCRYIDFFYNKMEKVGDITGRRYDPGPRLFDNGTSDPENKCFCQQSCRPSGAVNVSSCRFGAPAFVSFPHFHLADSSYAAAVSGLKPDNRKHDMYIILEEEWGIPLEVAIRLQINILIEPDPGIRMFNRIPTILFPMIWFEQKVTMPEDMQREIRTLLQLPSFGFFLSVGLYVVGFFCLVVYFFTSFVKSKREKNFQITRKPVLKRSPKIIRL